MNLGKQLKDLRTKHKLRLKDVVEDFTFPHKVYSIQDKPIHLGTLARYEEGSRKLEKPMFDALVRHIEKKGNNNLTGE